MEILIPFLIALIIIVIATILDRREKSRKQTDADASRTLIPRTPSFSEPETPYYTTPIPPVPDVIPQPFNYQAKWWQDLSQWYREQKAWQCEACKLSLHDHKQYLHTHHIWNTQYNEPKDLMALCIGCHSEQPGGNHRLLKETPEFQGFITKYGEKWGKRHISYKESDMSHIIPSREKIEDDNELYQQYWSEFQAYCTFKRISPTLLGIRGNNQKSYDFRMKSFNPYHISLNTYHLNGSTTISANLNLNKTVSKTRKIFNVLKSEKEHFQGFFEDELLFLDDRPSIFIIGCKKVVDIADPNDWLNQFEWICTNLEKLNTVFLPALRITQHYEETLLQG